MTDPKDLNTAAKSTAFWRRQGWREAFSPLCLGAGAAGALIALLVVGEWSAVIGLGFIFWLLAANCAVSRDGWDKTMG